MATLSDDFNRADSTNIGAAWSEKTGDYRIDANALQPVPGAGQSIVITTAQLDTTDHYIEATYVDPSGAASKGIIARADAGPNNYYLLRNNGSDWSLFSAVSGSFTSIGQYVAAAQAGDIARLQCVGDQIKAFINGIERIAVTNTAVTVGQYVGFRDADSGTHYDNFTAADTTGGGTTVTGVMGLSASGSLALAGLAIPRALMALSARGDLSFLGRSVAVASVEFGASGSLIAVGRSRALGALALGADGALTASGLARARGALSLSGSATMIAVVTSASEATVYLFDGVAWRQIPQRYTYDGTNWVISPNPRNL